MLGAKEQYNYRSGAALGGDMMKGGEGKKKVSVYQMPTNISDFVFSGKAVADLMTPKDSHLSTDEREKAIFPLFFPATLPAFLPYERRRRHI